MKKFYLATAGLALTGVAVAALSACSNDNQQSAPEPATNYQLTRVKAFTLPDGFRNVVFGCNGLVGVYVTSRGAYQNSGTDVASLPSSVSTVNDDPNCK